MQRNSHNICMHNFYRHLWVLRPDSEPVTISHRSRRKSRGYLQDVDFAYALIYHADVYSGIRKGSEDLGGDANHVSYLMSDDGDNGQLLQ